MDKSGRKYLTGSVMLTREKGGSEAEEYFIKSVIGEGSSAVCYEALRTRNDGYTETGKLKEFYPINSTAGSNSQHYSYSMERLPNGQLVPKNETANRFEQMCDEYIGAYQLLHKVIADNPENEILKGYIQHGEILYGCTDDEYQTPTVYIWSPGVAGVGFDSYLDKVRKNPRSEPENILHDILTVTTELTDCVKALHTAGLLHMDIKPSNFLVQYDSDFKINPNHISLFDINSLCSIDSEFIRLTETEGFSDPRISHGKVDNRSDIYSIGAMLFNAVVITSDIPDGLYRDCYYPRIAQLVKHSELFASSETNSNASLMSGLCLILEKCLAVDPRKRYQSCTELKHDLMKANKKLSDMLSAPVLKNSAALSEPTNIIQNLLYEHPLFESADGDGNDINVLVIGPGTYGQKFIDVCLQAGQMKDTRLNITAISDEPESNKNEYLLFRPAISEFINVNGSMCGKSETPYASLEFKSIEEITSDDITDKSFTGRMSQINRNIIDSIYVQSPHFDYAFVSLGSDSLNKSVARYLSDIAEHTYPVCYVSERKVNAKKADLAHKLYPVCVNTDVSLSQLNEMAFNTHLSWNPSTNIDVMSERRKFFDDKSDKWRYNRTSSLAFALSLPYKLHSIGIDCYDTSEAAEQFAKQIFYSNSSEEAKAKLDSLTSLEHRRWLIERACDGWKAPRDTEGRLMLEECVARGSVKDTVNRTHPCMVRASASSSLNVQQYIDNGRSLWDEGEIDSRLDELDRMSVELHRCFAEHAKELKEDNLLRNPDIIFIQGLIPPEYTEANRAFGQFKFALKNILIGVKSYCRQYDYYQDTFEKSLSELPHDDRVKITERLEIIKRAFFPVVESNLYRDYKAIDVKMIEKIPFILTYEYKPSLALAFDYGRHENGKNEAAFGDVASATVLNPESIKFLYCFNTTSDAELLTRKLDAVMNYCERRNVRCGIETVTVFLSDVSNAGKTQLKNGLTELQNKHSDADSNAWIENNVFIDAANYTDAVCEFIKYLKEHPVSMYDGSNSLFSSPLANSEFIGRIKETGIPYFEFDWRNKEFTQRIDCDYLKYIKDSSFIRIEDMFGLINATNSKFNFPEFADDYKELWKIYTGSYLFDRKFSNGVGNWNRLCMCLEKYESNRPPLADIELDTTSAPNRTVMTYFLPEFCYRTVKQLIQKLIDCGVAEEESDVVMYTTDTCRLVLTIDANYADKLDNVFAEPTLLLPYYNIAVSEYTKNGSRHVKIDCDNLTVTNVNLDTDGKGQYSFQILRELENKHYIGKIKQKEDNEYTVSFTYSSPRIKQLLTKAGEILEIYAYYEALKTGYFDDVACGYEFDWEYGDVNNELDLVLTKGFRSIIVECKAVVELQQEYYHKLNSIANQFGVGTTKVLLGNTYASYNRKVNEQNSAQKSRGEQLNIITVSDENDIIHIGRTLKKIINDNV